MNLKLPAVKSGHTQRSQRPQSFLHGPSVAGIMLISPLTKSVGDWVSRKFRLTHWENMELTCLEHQLNLGSQPA
jgi:hypothetical protein